MSWNYSYGQSRKSGNLIPDPSWEYYVEWHSLVHIQAKLSQALNFIKLREQRNTATDSQLRELLDATSDKLIDLVNSLPEKD